MENIDIKLQSKFEDMVKWETGNHRFNFDLSQKSDEIDFPFANLSRWGLLKMLISAFELGQKMK